MAPQKVTNETLAALMQAHHDDMSKRVDELTVAVRTTNGQVSKHGTEIAVIKTEQANDRTRIAALEIARQQPQPPPQAEQKDDGSKVSTKAVAVGLTAVGLVGGIVIQGIVALVEFLSKR